MGFLNIISLFDRFRRPILFYSKEVQMQSTKTGLFLSISIYSFMLYYLLSSEIVMRKNPKVVDQTIEISPRPEIYMKNVIFSVENTDSNSLVDPTLFSVGINLWNFEKLKTKKDGFTELYYLEEDLRPCRDDDFDPGVFDQYGFQNKYCFKNKTLSLRGYWDEIKLDYFSVSLRRCINTTENNNTCQSDDAIDEFFTDDKYFSVYFFNPFVDMRNYLEPIKSTWKTLFCVTDANAYKSYSVYIKKIEFTDDHNLPFVDEITYDLYNFDKVESDIRIKKRATDIVSYFFYTSNLVTQKIRRYQGLSDVLAQMGGLLGVFMMIGLLITEPEFQMNTVKAFFGERVSFKKNNELNIDDENNVIDSDRNPLDPGTPEKNYNNANPSEVGSIPSDPDFFKNDTERFEKLERDITKNTNKNLKEEPIKEIFTKTAKHEKAKDFYDGGNRGINIAKENKNFKKQMSVVEPIRNNIPKSKLNKVNFHKTNLDHSQKPKEEENKQDFTFSLLDYLKFKFKDVLNLRLKNKENVFKNLENKFREDLNVGYLIQRVYILENRFNLLLSIIPPELNTLNPDNSPKPQRFKSKKISIFNFLED